MFDIKNLLVVATLFVGGSVVAMEEKKEGVVTDFKVTLNQVNQVVLEEVKKAGASSINVPWQVILNTENIELKNIEGMITEENKKELTTKFIGEVRNILDDKVNLNKNYEVLKKSYEALDEEKKKMNATNKNLNGDISKAVRVESTTIIVASLAIIAFGADQLCETNYLKKFVTKCGLGLKSLVKKAKRRMHKAS